MDLPVPGSLEALTRRRSMISNATENNPDRWSGGVCPFDAGWRKVMMWVFIVTDGLLFAGFLASYGFARLSHPEWPPQGEIFNLSFLAVMTFVLISSSATMASAVGAAGPAAPVPCAPSSA